MRIRAEINEIFKWKLMKKINKTKSCFLEKINNINKPLTQAKRKKKKRKDQSSNISNE